ncbi:unnamed protein product [Rangifer tarandus platyrhynchus]|uniref:Uncharacterized protein n=2 Tax=Rangifer tarandus platyrhynchus TaxID=3082113 RepID=A0ABN9A5V4_RANTA|nr:unnamed protein product [Rangifer tarandus platyrhynchus]
MVSRWPRIGSSLHVLRDSRLLAPAVVRAKDEFRRSAAESRGSGVGKAAAASPPSGAAASRTERSGSSLLFAARTPSTSGREACPPRLSPLEPTSLLLATVVALIRAFLFPRLSEIAS